MGASGGRYMEYTGPGGYFFFLSSHYKPNDNFSGCPGQKVRLTSPPITMVADGRRQLWLSVSNNNLVSRMESLSEYMPLYYIVKTLIFFL